MGSHGKHTIALMWTDGRTAQLSISADTSILEAAEATGFGLPFGCRYGACGTCTARVLEGSVTHLEPPRALKDRHLDAGYALTCVAAPQSDCRLSVGATVQAELVEIPWK